ncbi:protein turtle-like isoform X3 [Poecilia formosa]|uniref:protein turtle-like isoform X3 n=1 Tax=Poecilia formosa TaxID=48698 RepID=UPI0007B97206|nr:PREDICTED: protein turtle-like isoform X3 [Poecilia formosa]
MFKDRVDLQDKQMKDGNVSLVLRNVTTDDRGAYECRVVQTNSRTETVFIINLDVLPPPDQTRITAHPGQNTSLPCRSPDNKPVAVVEWIRPDLGSEYVFLYRNRKINSDHQHPSFKGRVDLQDRQMKDGNVSLALRNVTTDDRGAYECQVIQRETNSRTETVFIINLDVLPPPDQRNITAQAGQNTSLPCRSPDNKPVVVVEWIRPDLGSEYVLLYRNDQLDLENKHVMFKDRVDLQDRQMKDGNVSLVLRKVTTDDRGAYECQVVQRETNSRRKTIVIINLDVLPPPDQTSITAEPGQNTSLPCRSPDNKPVVVVEWIRPDLGSEYVLLYRNRKINSDHQHPSFKGRVDLQDRQMKDGNVSLALRNVTTDDRGAYECQVVQRETNSRRMTIVIINLDVLPPPGEPDGVKRDGSDLVLVVGVSVGVVVGLVALGIILYLIRKKALCWSPKPNQPPVDPAGAQQLLTNQNQPAEQKVQSDLQDDGSRTSADPSSRITD